jgi:hypothetical protein
MLKILRFVNLLLVALTFGLTWCHVMEIPGKLRLTGNEWLMVQHNLYLAFGPPLGAPIEVAAIVLSWVVFLLVLRRGPAAPWTLAAAICVTAGLAVWFWLVSPMNMIISGLAPQNIPADWTEVRNQWEIGHAVHALLFGLGFSALVIALLAETPSSSRRGGPSC